TRSTAAPADGERAGVWLPSVVDGADGDAAARRAGDRVQRFGNAAGHGQVLPARAVPPRSYRAAAENAAYRQAANPPRAGNAVQVPPQHADEVGNGDHPPGAGLPLLGDRS